MSLVVEPAFLISRQQPGYATLATKPVGAWRAVFALILVTFFFRLALLLGVKHLGGMQTALPGLGELRVTLACTRYWLGGLPFATAERGAAAGYRPGAGRAGENPC